MTDIVSDLKDLLRRFGFNRAISYGVLTRAWSLIAGPMTILMIASRLTTVQQGFYYTIASLQALQIFFELGLMTLIAQFASHEFNKLNWGPKGEVEGDFIARERFFDLLEKGARWFTAAAASLLLILVPLGLVFLGSKEGGSDFSWRIPWLLAVLGTASNTVVIPFFAVVLGSGEVSAVNHREMIAAMAASLLSWLVLGLHGGLYAIAAVTFGHSLISWWYLLRRKPEMLRELWKRWRAQHVPPPEARVSWRREVWPLQWKMALTWIAGYFVSQLFTPVLFQYQGAVVAGQMGMTLSASNALLAVSLTWISSSVPEFGKLVAREDWRGLDILFSRVLKQSFVVVLLGAIVGTLAIAMLQRYFPLGHRFLPASHAAVLFAAIAGQVLVSGLASYLRAHKKEPLFPLSVGLGFLQGAATWFFGMKFGSFGIVMSYLVLTVLVALPGALLVWRRCRNQWHRAGSI